MRRLMMILALAGCAGSPAGDSRPVAEDPVCRYNRDLGCVRVRVDETTPRALHAGVTYYFCREGCREAFEKDPQRYLPRPPRPALLRQETASQN